MSLTRCPQCGRVADGRSCFACGYEWPRTGVTAVPPASSAPPPPAARTGPFASPLAPPRAPTPMAQPSPSSPPPAAPSLPSLPSSPPASMAPAPQQTGALTRQPMPHPFAQPTTSPFASGPPTTSPFTTAPPSPFAQPFRQPPPPPPPDDIVIDSDISFSLMSDAIPPSAGGLPLPAPPPGLPPPPMPAFPAPPPGLPPPPMALPSMPPLAPPPAFGVARPPSAPSDGGIPASTLDTIFDGIDISVPTAPARMSDPAMEAGDFMIDTGPPPAPPPAPAAPPAGDSEWATSSALGADLLAAFNNAGDPTESDIPVTQGQSLDARPANAGQSLNTHFDAGHSFDAGSFDAGAFDGGPSFDVSFDGPGPGLPPPPPGPDPVVQFSAAPPAPAPLTDRLRNLAQTLRAQGRSDDADLVTEAMALIKLQS